MSLLFRPGRPEDVLGVARLASHSFPGVRASLREWEDSLVDSPHGGLETLWVGEESDRLVAACRLYSFEQWIGGQKIPTMGLGTVTISATARRRGIASALIESAFTHARERGDLASALYPFRTAFYRRLGYGLAGEIQQYRIPPSTLRESALRSRVRLVESDRDRAALAEVYEQWVPRQTGQLARPARAWELVWQRETRHAVLFRDERDEPRGYLVFAYGTDPARGGRLLEVEEIVWLDGEARQGLYGWAASMSDQWDQLIYRAHPEEGFPDHLEELRYPVEGVPRWHFWFPAATTMYGPMFRILDVQGAWASRSVHAGPPVALALEVHDEHVPANSGKWTLRLADGAAEMAKGADPSVGPRLALDIEALSRIYVGAISPSAAVAAGVARADDPDLLGPLDDLLRLPRPWTFDRF